MESITESFRKVLEYENLLNEFSGKRYHIVQRIDQLFDIIEVKKIGDDNIIVMGLNLFQLYAYLKRHMKITLDEKDGWKKLEHVRELWDKLDPRDRDIILKHSKFEINTLYDWKALSREQQENIVKWFYY